MTYATRQDMVDQFGEREVIALTDREDTGEIDEVVLQRGLEAADREINPYIVSRYQLPFATVPDILRDKACDIARYRLCGAGVIADDDVRERYSDAIKFLDKVHSGRASLGTDVALVEVSTRSPVKVAAPDQVFNAHNLDGY